MLASLIKQNGKMFLNYNKSQISGFANDRSGGIGEITGFTANLESDVSLAVDTIIHILSFSYLLLSNTCNKDRYSSVEVSE